MEGGGAVTWINCRVLDICRLDRSEIQRVWKDTDSSPAQNMLVWFSDSRSSTARVRLAHWANEKNNSVTVPGDTSTTVSSGTPYQRRTFAVSTLPKWQDLDRVRQGAWILQRCGEGAFPEVGCAACAARAA